MTEVKCNNLSRCSHVVGIDNNFILDFYFVERGWNVIYN